MVRLLNVYSIFFIVTSFAIAVTFRILILHLANPLTILNIHVFLMCALAWLLGVMFLFPYLTVGIKILIDFIFGLDSMQDFDLNSYSSLLYNKFNIIAGFFAGLGFVYFVFKFIFHTYSTSRFSVSSLIAVLITWLVLIVESVVVVKSARAARTKAVENGLNQNVVVCSLLLVSGLAIALGSGYDLFNPLIR